MNNFYKPDFPKNLIPLLSYAGLSLKHTNNKLLVYSLKNVIPHWPRYMYLLKKMITCTLLTRATFVLSIILFLNFRYTAHLTEQDSVPPTNQQ